MSKDNAPTSSGGIGTLCLLGILFIALKLTHVIDWSWWWITAPFWVIPPMFVFVIFVVAAYEVMKDRKRVVRGRK